MTNELTPFSSMTKASSCGASPPSPSPNEVFCASAIFALVAALFFRVPLLRQSARLSIHWSPLGVIEFTAEISKDLQVEGRRMENE
jgi:hypothetical protein